MDTKTKVNGPSRTTLAVKTPEKASVASLSETGPEPGSCFGEGATEDAEGRPARVKEREGRQNGRSPGLGREQEDAETEEEAKEPLLTTPPGLAEERESRQNGRPLDLGRVEEVKDPLFSAQPDPGEDGEAAGVRASSAVATSETQQDRDSEDEGLPRGEGGDSSAGEEREECPVCTEPLGAPGGGGTALLNCSHALCHACLAGMLRRAADPSRLKCPLCRQGTPLLEWQIRRMQEEAASLMGGTGGGVLNGGGDIGIPTPPPSPTPPSRGAEGWLETRVARATVCGCVRLPARLTLALGRLRRRCRCCYLACLLLLYLTEVACLLLVFLPVLVLVLLFTLAGK